MEWEWKINKIQIIRLSYIVIEQVSTFLTQYRDFNKSSGVKLVVMEPISISVILYGHTDAFHV